MLSSQSPPAVAKKLKNGATWGMRLRNALGLQPLADDAGALLSTSGGFTKRTHARRE
jgi:hypothetical protein